jgi:hypothetical protein
MAGKEVENAIIFSREDWGEIAMFLIIAAVNEFGNYIENNPTDYSCPSYCEVNHKHINIEENNEYTRIDSGLFIQPIEQGAIAEGVE